MTQTATLPKKGVLFLGGHQNMTKKLKQHFPRWTFIGEDQISRCSTINQDLVFYWTKHSSHKLTKCACSKLSPKSRIFYVTATNLALLVDEMVQQYSALNKEG